MNKVFLFVSIVVCTGIAGVAAMRKILFVNFSDVNSDPVRLTVGADRSVGSEDELIELLKGTGLVLPETFYLETMDRLSGRYIAIDNSLLKNWKAGPLSVLVISSCQRSNEQLAIGGRLFDLSKGLPFMNGRHKLQILEDGDAEQGTGLNSWDGSVVLAKYLEKHPDVVTGCRVLELGAGTGIAGIAAALLGAHYVLLTDLEYVLSNLRNNVLHNCDHLILKEKDRGKISQTVEVALLDWADKTTYAAGADGELHSWDLLLGADVVWLEHLVSPLTEVLSVLIPPGSSTEMLLAHQLRSERTDRLLFGKLVEKGFIVQKEDRQELQEGYTSPVIDIYKVRRTA